ncbi:hypothetical protein AB171_09730 [Bacillus anthracis]|nr:hypothetical protein OY21_10570 [Bacillus anthracis]KGZ63947.1 hypothetical protein OY25_18700 [Bacillus anthracis]KKM36451.1 hypothetical protein JF23_03890 [Bacillus anthracis]KKM38310.1 hypothetical protein KD34_03750 [Bacillus anthracis]KON18401.1 hypothetical protein AB171_09730 [Bacillus anthracis]
MGVAPFLFVIQNDRIYSSWLFYASFYALLTVILMIFIYFYFIYCIKIKVLIQYKHRINILLNF